MVVKKGRFGPFLACSGYPKCKSTRNLARDEQGRWAPEKQETGEVCEKCGRPMVIKRGRRGPFLACSGYPDCKNTRNLERKAQPAEHPQDEPTGETCDQCGRPMVQRKGRYGPFLGCSGYPECKNTRKLRPTE
jgi:DNA topoisomerase-1